MSDKLILTVDFGTQSVRVGLFNKKGDIIAIEKCPYDKPYFSVQPGFCEQDPMYYYNCFISASQKLFSKYSDLKKDILGLSVTCFRDSHVILDKDDNILRPAILWLDERKANLDEKLPLLYRFFFFVSGMKSTIKFNRERTPAHWIKENEPEIWKKVDKYMNISTFLIYKITGEYVDSPASQTGHFPIHFKKRQWYKSDRALKGIIYGIPKKFLCKLVPVGGILGKVNKETSSISGIPEGLDVYSVGSDKSCEVLGLGVINSRTAAISYGTASTINIPSRRYCDAETFLPSYPSALPDYYNIENQVYRGYWMLNWFSKEFGQAETLEAAIQHKLVLDILNEKVLKIPAGSEGLILQPYWGPGLKRPLAKGSIIGFSEKHTKMHLYRAIIEGIAYALREALEFYEKNRLYHKISNIMISGGGAQSDAICQITADIFGVRVGRVQTFETSSLGAAIAGFLIAKEYETPQIAILNMVKKTDVFEPNIETHLKYDYYFKNAYLKIYPKLKNIYKKNKRVL